MGQVLCSPGIGRIYTDNMITKDLHKYRPGKTIDYYRLNTGSQIKLPTYYKNKFVNEDQKETIWREFMDKDIISIMGTNYEPQTAGNKAIGNILSKAQENNRKLEYGDNSKEFRKKEYNITKRMLQQVERQKQIDKMRKALGMPTLYSN